jgi:23S rRNA pseudouridine1911/1915/1917 synthase
MTTLMRYIQQRTRGIGYKYDSLRLFRSCYTARTATTATLGEGSFENPHKTSGGYSFLVDEADVQGSSKLRLDAFLSQKLSSMPENKEEEESQSIPSRARLQSTIKEGRVVVNGKLLTKASYAVKVGDSIQCSVIPPPPLRANPENIPLDIVYEDEHVIVIDKTADMVMHPSPGHCSGTMVNALLYHCGISEGIPLDDSDPGMGSSLDSTVDASNNNNNKSIRPGIVHRLDKGTTGLVVVAKSDIAHASLSKQFKDRTVEREYISITLGIPRPDSCRIATNIGRDFRDRKKMAAFEYECTRGKVAASNYKVLEVLGASNCALVSWRLETGRTHQIRVHAKHIRHPLLGDDVYGGSDTAAARVIGRGKSNLLSTSHKVVHVLQNRPALHAQVLGFEHPTTHERLRFTAGTPTDFATVLEILRDISS